MPHATNGTMTNGSTSQKTPSKFLNHLADYPIVSDTLNTIQTNPYTKKPIALGSDVYTKYSGTVTPYLEKPYGYAKPYVTRADELADSGLQKVETQFPIVKEETGVWVEKGKEVVWWPASVAGKGRDYVMSTWDDEYSKTLSHNDRKPGLSTSVMAIISTELKLASDFFQAVADFLGPKYEASKQKTSDLVAEGQEKGQELFAQGKETAEKYQGVAADKAKEAGDKGEELKRNGESKVEQGKKEAQKAQAEAGKKAQGQK